MALIQANILHILPPPLTPTIVQLMDIAASPIAIENMRTEYSNLPSLANR